MPLLCKMGFALGGQIYFKLGYDFANRFNVGV